ncbi:E2-like enzyme [Serendipita sp. 401]|nr:E2-like enzyme [Serendipita sp. 401]
MLKNSIQGTFLRVSERMASVSKESKFKETGKITPEEFVIAGDFLVYKFPLWSWQKGDAKPREHLPVDKQYLLLQGAPCPKRATALVYTDAEEDAEQMLNLGGGNAQEDEWVQTHAKRGEIGSFWNTRSSFLVRNTEIWFLTSSSDLEARANRGYPR